MQDKYIVDRPLAGELKPPTNPFVDKLCLECRKDLANRIEWSENCGTIKDWLETLEGCELIADCINWWNCVNAIRWDISSTRQLASAYVAYLSNLVSLQTWGKSLSKRFTAVPLTA